MGDMSQTQCQPDEVRVPGQRVERSLTFKLQIERKNSLSTLIKRRLRESCGEDEVMGYILKDLEEMDESDPNFATAMKLTRSGVDRVTSLTKKRRSGKDEDQKCKQNEEQEYDKTNTDDNLILSEQESDAEEDEEEQRVQDREQEAATDKHDDPDAISPPFVYEQEERNREKGRPESQELELHGVVMKELVKYGTKYYTNDTVDGTELTTSRFRFTRKNKYYCDVHQVFEDNQILLGTFHADDLELGPTGFLVKLLLAKDTHDGEKGKKVRRPSKEDTMVLSFTVPEDQRQAYINLFSKMRKTFFKLLGFK